MSDKVYIDGEAFEFTRVKNDINGNPRWVIHWTSLENPASRDNLAERFKLTLHERYARAVRLANLIGGRKYHTKGYGGGIVFTSYALTETVAAIKRIR